jgi:hypothetical protein
LEAAGLVVLLVLLLQVLVVLVIPVQFLLNGKR